MRAGPDAKERRLRSFAAVIAAIVGCVFCVWFGLNTIVLDLPAVQASFPAAPYALDGHRHLLVASIVAQGGDPYSVAGYFYPPLGAAMMIPLAAVGADLGLWAWFAIKVAVLAWCVWDASRGLSWSARLVAGAFVATLTCVVDDLWLGNVSIPIAAAIYLAISRNRPWAAIPLGILTAAVAKPFLLPVLLWMLVFRRRSGISALATAAVATGIGIVATGPTAYGEYVAALLTATRADFEFGLGLSAIAPELLVPLSIAVLAIFAILLRRSRDETSLLVWSLLVGLIAAPYVTHYSLVPVLAAIPAFARAHPSRSLWMAAIAAPVSLVAIVTAAILGLAIAFPTDALRQLLPAGHGLQHAKDPTDDDSLRRPS